MAAQTSAEFVKRGKLAAGDTYLFQAVAFAQNGNGNGKPAGGLQLEVVEETRAGVWSNRASTTFRAAASPAGVVDADDMPVFIPQRVLDEAAALTRAADGRETGGVLIGRLHRDAALPEIFAEVTAQIPAEHTQGTAAKLTFTAETWSAASAAIRLRSQGEVYLGYWHSPPGPRVVPRQGVHARETENVPTGQGLLQRRRPGRDAGGFPARSQPGPGGERHAVCWI